MCGIGESELRLSRRQIQALQLVANGDTLREVALKLGLKHQYVKNLMGIIRRRLHAKSTVQAVGIALRKGIIK